MICIILVSYFFSAVHVLSQRATSSHVPVTG